MVSQFHLPPPSARLLNWWLGEASLHLAPPPSTSLPPSLLNSALGGSPLLRCQPGSGAAQLCQVSTHPKLAAYSTQPPACRGRCRGASWGSGSLLPAVSAHIGFHTWIRFSHLTCVTDRCVLSCLFRTAASLRCSGPSGNCQLDL